GEGHLSSIEFRSGLLDAQGDVTFDEPGLQVVGGRRAPPSFFDKTHFGTKLLELGVSNDLSLSVLSRLNQKFTLDELETSLSALETHGPPAAVWFETVKVIRVLASSNYLTTFPADSELAERVIFPAGPNETRGMEDARFLRFTTTDDFVRFRISTLNGAGAQNKGMALFPRTIDGKYVMLSRKDRENLYLATSS